jgi:hypothetical protein
VFHENGLGADPSAEYPAENNGKEYDKNDADQHREHQQVKILRPERISENDVFPFQYIEHQELVSVYFDKRCYSEKDQQ